MSTPTNKKFLGHQCLCSEEDGKIKDCILNGIRLEKDEPLEECSALKEWARWVKIRQTCPLPSVARDNTHRIVREQKELYELGQKEIPLLEEISTEHISKDPEIWFTSIPHPTELPQPAQIRVPEVIIQEINPTLNKDISDKTSNKKHWNETPISHQYSKLIDWNKNPYRINVSKESEKNLKNYCSHFVTQEDGNELIIIGKKLAEKKPPPPPQIPEITITECEDNISQHRELYLHIKQDPIFFTFIREISAKTTNCFCKKFLELSNSSTVCIRWRFYIETEWELSRQRFILGSQFGTILPGQITKIPIWFTSKKPGYFLCNFIIRFQPKLIQSVRIQFIGIATYEDNYARNKLESVRDYIENRVREKSMENIISELVSRIRPIIPPRPEYLTLFSEIELFETINPNFKYHLNHIITLKQIYNELHSDDKEKIPWNFSINTLKRQILSYPNFEQRENWFKSFSMACRGMLLLCLEVATRDPDWFRKRTLCSLALGLLFEKIEKQGIRLRKWLIGITKRPAFKTSLTDDYFMSLSPRSNDRSDITNSSSLSDMTNENDDNLTVIDNYLSDNFNFFESLCPLKKFHQMLYISTYKYLSDAIDNITSILETYNIYEKPKEIVNICGGKRCSD